MYKSTETLTEKQYKLLVDNSSDIIFCVDKEGRFIYANINFRKKLKGGICKIEESKIWDFLCCNYLREFKKMFMLAFENKTYNYIETNFKSKSGEVLKVEGTLKYVYDEENEFPYIFGIFADKTNIKTAYNKLNALTESIEHSRDIILFKDLNLNITEANNSLLELVGAKSIEEIRGKKFFELFELNPNNPEVLESREDDIETLKLNDGEFIIRQGSIITPEGKKKSVITKKYPIFNDEDKPLGIGVVVQDITGLKKLEDRYKKLFENVPIVIWEEDYSELKKYLEKIYAKNQDLEEYFRNNPDEIMKCINLIKVVDVNKYALSFYKAESKEELKNNLNRVFTKRSTELLIPEFKAILEGKTTFIAENETQTLQGEKKTIIMEIKSLENFSKVYLTVIDITDLKNKQAEIEFLSFHDHLTGLYNRRYIEDSMKRLDTKRNYPFCIMVLDVNGLKLTNDAFGHDVGDELLKRVAVILNKTCRKSDIIGRFGGDEFVLLLPNTSEVEAKEIKKRILNEALNYSFKSVIISLSIGFAVKENEEEDIFDKLKEADNYMYRYKVKEGRDMRSKTLDMVIDNINSKSKEEEIHKERVAKYCELTANMMKMKEKDILDLRAAGMLHDIGKILVPEKILNKKSKLNKEEFDIVKKHPVTAYQILKNINEYSHLAEAVLHHHERWDGKGYPKKLSEKEIPLMSRIIAVAEAYEVMTAKRLYRKLKTKEEALEELRNEKGKQFDPEIVDIFIECINKY